MPNLSSIVVAGYLGRDPEYKTTQSGDSLVSFSLARSRKSGGGETTTWYRCTIWGARGNVIMDHAKKGSAMIVSGEHYAGSYTNKDGAEVMTNEIYVRDFTFGGGGKSNEEPTAPAPRNAGAMYGRTRQEMEDDITF